MKKLALLATATAAAAALSISGNAMAIEEGAVFDIFIEGDDAGSAVFDFQFTSNLIIDSVLRRGSCAFILFWTNPVGDRTLRCGVRESRTNTFPNCQINRTRDINGTMFAGAPFATNCSGFRRQGLAFGPEVGLPSGQLVLGERAVDGAATLSGTFFNPFFPAAFESIVFDRR